MSRFFQNLDEEKKQIKKKTDAIADEQTARASKAEKKLGDLEAQVATLRSTEKKFEGAAKKFIGELKKFSKSFEKDGVPEFLTDFLTDERVSGNSQLKGMAEGFLARYTSRDAEHAHAQSTGPSVQGTRGEAATTLSDIMEIGSDDRKEQELIAWGETAPPAEEGCAVAIALFSIYYRRRDAGRMIWALRRHSRCFAVDSPSARAFLRGMDLYLGKIYACLGPEDHESYGKLLDALQGYAPEVAESRRLELSFFKLSQCPETEHAQFRLLYLARSGQWAAAREYFTERLSRMVGGEEGAEAEVGATQLSILQEFSQVAIKHGDFRIAFDVLVFCEARGVPGLKDTIYALCVILNHSVKESAAFAVFLNDFKRFDTNIFVLRSRDPRDEVFRAFYLFNVYDYAAAARIIREISDIECEDVLRGGVLDALGLECE